jgi:hypothetical protein
VSPEEVIKRLDEVGEWTSDKTWEQNAIAAEAQRVIRRLMENHKCVVRIKRITNERLKTALASLQKVYNESREGFERATHE